MRKVPKWKTLAGSTAPAPASMAGAKWASVPAPPLAITGTVQPLGGRAPVPRGLLAPAQVQGERTDNGGLTGNARTPTLSTRVSD